MDFVKAELDSAEEEQRYQVVYHVEELVRESTEQSDGKVQKENNTKQCWEENNNENINCISDNKESGGTHLDSELQKLFCLYELHKNAEEFVELLVELFEGNCKKHEFEIDGKLKGSILNKRLQNQLYRFIMSVPSKDKQKLLFKLLLNRASGLSSSEEIESYKELEHHYMNYAKACSAIYQPGEKECIKLSFASTDEIKERETPLQMLFLEEGYEIIQTHCTINGKELDLREEYQLIKTEEDCLNLRFSSIYSIYFGVFENICYLDISHTFIIHVDVRSLIMLQELHLLNTNIKRLNLINEDSLSTLSCNYTLICYICLASSGKLEKLHAESLEQLKSNKLIDGGKLFLSSNEVINNHRGKTVFEKEIKEYTVYESEEYNNCEFELSAPQNCNEILLKDSKPFNKLAIGGEKEGEKIIIDECNIVGFLNLQSIDVYELQSKELSIAHLPELLSIRILYSYIKGITITKAPQLQNVCVNYSYFDFSEINELPSLSLLDVRDTNIVIRNLLEFIKLKILYPNNEEMIEQARNLPYLIYLAPINIEMENVEIRGFKTLQKIYAFQLKCNSFSINDLPLLRELDIRNTNIVITNIAEFKELTILATSNQNVIDEIRNTSPEQLEVLNVSQTQLANIDIDGLTNLKKLYIHMSSISEIDLRNFKKLIKVTASKICEISHCCCDIIWKD